MGPGPLSTSSCIYRSRTNPNPYLEENQREPLARSPLELGAGARQADGPAQRHRGRADLGGQEKDMRAGGSADLEDQKNEKEGSPWLRVWREWCHNGLPLNGRRRLKG